MEILGIIPARGGSKGIPRKNIQMVAGKPLIAHSILCAQAVTGIDRVIVSTDSSEISEVSKSYGAEVIHRPDQISGDSASSEDALLYTLDRLSAKDVCHPDLLVFMQCTSPLTLPEDVEGTIKALLDNNADSGFTAAPFHYFVWRKTKDGEVIGINHDKRVRPLRQDREDQYLETGAVYVMRVDGFKKARHRFFGKTVFHLIPPERCFEIDDPRDLIIADALLRDQQRERGLSLLPEKISGLALDFDGVLTDNKVIVLESGVEAVLSHRGDGWGIGQLKKYGLPIIVISTERNPVVKARCDKLGIECVHGVTDKKTILLEWIKQKDLNPQGVVYLGNDVNDLDCLMAAGCGVVVGDAHPDVRRAARLILNASGGKGAVRELADMILKRMG